jgi:protein-tyrosine phosphatase
VETKEILVSAGFWVISIIVGLVVLWWFFRQAVQRGGRNVKPLHPEDLIIYPAGGVHTPVNEKRFVKLDGAYNFRDLGGYSTQDGRSLPWGMFFRSDELSEISDTDLVTLQNLHLRTIVDLRSPREIKSKGNRLPVGSRYRQIQIYKREPIMDYLWVVLFRRHLLAQALGGNYIRMVETRALAFGEALRFLTQPDNYPIVYHCSAGKDRTGILSALTLSVLGVAEETIIADYTLSNLGFDHYFAEFIAEGRLDRWQIPYEEFQAFFIVHPEWMRNLLTYLDKRYGSVENYLLQKAGLTQEELESIRENLLE